MVLQSKWATFRIRRFNPGVVSSLNEFGNLGFAADYISQGIADFAGDPKNLYTITYAVIRPLEELNKTRPTLFVSLDSLELVSSAVKSGVLFAVALLCALLSLIFAAVFYYLRGRARLHTTRAQLKATNLSPNPGP
jgi:hypothetical protein